jgi:excinuclease UvrABC nuclease subunit
MPLRSFTLSRKQIDRYRKPGVYVLKRNGTPIYIGVGATGVISRCCSLNHHRQDAMDKCDSITIHTCDSKAQAEALEIALIHMWKPKYNRTDWRGQLLTAS